eukprot:676536-Alexandrium_andersonii.AAC.1
MGCPVATVAHPALATCALLVAAKRCWGHTGAVGTAAKPSQSSTCTQLRQAQSSPGTWRIQCRCCPFVVATKFQANTDCPAHGPNETW